MPLSRSNQDPAPLQLPRSMTDGVDARLTGCRIALICAEQFPVKKANCEQVINTASALASEGLSVDLIAPWKWKDLAIGRHARRLRLSEFYDVGDGFGFIELARPPIAPAAVDKLSHGVIAPLYAAMRSYDIIYTRNSIPALIGLALGKRVVYEAYRHYGHFGSPTARLLVQSRSRHLLGTIVHSESSKQSLIRAGVPRERVAAIHNGFNPSSFQPPLTTTEARQRLGWNKDQHIACYAGRVDMEKGMMTLVDLAARTPEIQYVFVGYSEEHADDWIVEAAARRGAVNVRQVPWCSPQQLAMYLYAADVLLIPPTAHPLEKYGKTVLPMKTFPYMAVGRPILAPALTDMLDILGASDAALVEPDDLDAAERTIRRVYSDPDWARSIAERSRAKSAAYTWRQRAKRIMAFLETRLRADP